MKGYTTCTCYPAFAKGAMLPGTVQRAETRVILQAFSSPMHKAE